MMKWMGLSLILALAGHAQTNAALKPELAPLSFFQGTWICDGKFLASDRKISSDMAFQTVLDGAWLMVRHDDRAPNRFHALELWGFDKTGNQFVAMVSDNGGSTRKFTSPGWADDRLVWTGDALAPDKNETQHFLFEKKGPRQFIVTFELRQKDGGWKPIDALTCGKED